MNGFGENLKLMALHAGPVEEVRRGGLPGKEENFAVGKHPADGDRSIDAIHVSHDHVGNQHVWPNCASRLDCFFSAVNRGGLEPALVQDNGQRVRDYSLVISDQYFGFCLSSVHLLLRDDLRRSGAQQVLQSVPSVGLR
jgi:hypothetical protein